MDIRTVGTEQKARQKGERGKGERGRHIGR